ncbi:hypothetical protein PYW08_015819 [Mythimna loreyi]|uniref:Uncharacterized protein n=1 Tax=Mythimna loreyi TaxID=667449 RepID=A0ACC2QVZ6_9NEOP|nr:hypothetical protein PYW08_015819 [Mythimna loreyi]
MPAKCGGCGKFVSASDSTKCTKCGSVYHRTCVGLPAKGPATTIGQCPECRRNVRRDNKAETPVRGLVTELQKEESAEVQLSTPPPLPVSSPVVSPPPDVAAPPSAVVSHHDIPQDVGAALRLVAEELRTLKFEVLELRRDVAEIKAANESCHIRMDGIESRLEVLEKRQCEGCVSSADSGVVEQLKRDLNDRDQELMSNDVVITNVPEALDSACGGDPNAVYSTCPSACERTCENPDPQICTLQCLEPGCVCKPGYLKSARGKCIKLEACPDSACGGDPNAVYSTCPSACERTCENPDPQICTLQCLEPGCVCKPGYLKSARGKCIKLEACPAEPQCNGDRNATYNQSPSFCQATCKNPDPEEECMDMPMPPGCVCKSGFLRSKKGGKCLRPQDCPGGWPTCRKNETYVYCNVGCPTNYCPVDDSLAIIACDPPYPCPGGCACKRGYLMASVDDDRCILSSECPPVTCTRPNEVWDPYAPGCLHERCDDKDIPCDFQYPGPPRCRCIEGFYRNQDEICVPESECCEYSVLRF